MNQPVTAESEQQGSTKSYVIGFVLSLALTLGAYMMAQGQMAHGWALIYALGALAVIQLVVQLVFFLHLGKGSSARWNRTVLLFAALVVFIVVFGSLWIMKNLSYGHHLQDQPSQQIIKDEGYGR